MSKTYLNFQEFSAFLWKNILNEQAVKIRYKL